MSTCPSCRVKFVETSRLYPDFLSENEAGSPHQIQYSNLYQELAVRDGLIVDLQSQLSQYGIDNNNLKEQLLQKKEQIKKYEVVASDRNKLITNKEKDLKNLRDRFKEQEKLLLKRDETVAILEKKSKIAPKLDSKISGLTKLNEDLNKQIDDLQIKLIDKSVELVSCHKAAEKRNKLIKELRGAKASSMPSSTLAAVPPLTSAATPSTSAATPSTSTAAVAPSFKAAVPSECQNKEHIANVEKIVALENEIDELKERISDQMEMKRQHKMNKSVNQLSANCCIFQEIRLGLPDNSGNGRNNCGNSSNSGKLKRNPYFFHTLE